MSPDDTNLASAYGRVLFGIFVQLRLAWIFVISTRSPTIVVVVREVGHPDASSFQDYLTFALYARILLVPTRLKGRDILSRVNLESTLYTTPTLSTSVSLFCRTRLPCCRVPTGSVCA